MVTVTGSASNAVASSFLSEIRVWTFIDWMRYGLPAFLLIFPITWWVLTKLINVTTRVMDISIAKRELEDMGNLASKELEIIGVMIITASLWAFGPRFEDIIGLTEGFLSPPVVGVVAVTYMSLRAIIDWDDVKDVSWGMFFTLGAGLALGEALTRTGATEWLTSLISPIIFQAPMLASLLMLIFASALATNVVNNTTIAAIFVPIFINMSKVNPEFNAIQLVLPLTLATTFGYSLPSASGRMALLSSMKIIESRDMMRYGTIFTVISSVILALFFFVITEIKLL